MSDIIIQATELSPKITISQNDGINLSGQSRMEDASNFYAPIHDWLNDNLDSLSNIQISFELNYFNSSSAKQILKFLMQIDESEIDSQVKWKYPSGNDILKERGEELAIMLDIPFSFITD